MIDTENLIAAAEQAYGIQVTAHKTVKPGGRSSLVARLEAPSGKAYVIKGLYTTTQRQRFIAEAERLLAERGVPLARPVPAGDGSLCFHYEGAPFVLYEWIDGPGAPLDKEADLIAIADLAARMHLASRGLVFPKDVQRYGHLDWRLEYEQRIRSMESWQSEHGDAIDGKKAAILQSLPFFLEEGKRALEALCASEYGTYRDGGLDPPTLVHGDLHHRNVLISKTGLTLIDLEDVRYDAPSKDLLRILSMYTKSHPFDGGMFRRLLRAYWKRHKISREMRRIIRIDMWFPHIFERLLRKKVYRRMDRKRLRFFLEQERKKAEFIRKRYFSGAGHGGEEA